MKLIQIFIMLAFGLTAKGETDPAIAQPSGNYKLIARYPGPHIPVNRGWILVGAEQAGAGVIQMYLFNTENGQTVIWYTIIQP